MAQPSHTKKLFLNRFLQVNSTLFNDKRLTEGLSILQLALNVNMAPETVRRALIPGSDSRPSTIKRLGEYLGIPPDQWYIPRERATDDSVGKTETVVPCEIEAGDNTQQKA